MKQENCPVCHLPEAIQKSLPFDGKDAWSLVECPRCGTYKISYVTLSSANLEQTGPLLCAWIRDLKERGAAPPELNANTIKVIKDSLRDYTPSQKQIFLMKNIERRTKYPGASVDLSMKHDYPLSWASCEDEFDFFLKGLQQRQLLTFDTDVNPHYSIEDRIGVWITPKGWDYIEENSKLSIISDQAFVAMRFSKDLEGPYENAIKKAIEDAGYKAYRIDRENHGNRIDVKIMAEIKNSRFVVADVTHQNQGVYFEAGYALGLGIPVIWSCRENDFENRHFDTKQYQHIKWESEDQLREELFTFICAIIGKNSKPREFGAGNSGEGIRGRRNWRFRGTLY